MRAISEALREAAPGVREVAAGEWGLRVQDVGPHGPSGGGWPLDVGLALDAGGTLLRLQAEVCGPGRTDPHALLHRNRRVPLVKLTETRAGVVWIEAWLPVAAITAAELDRVLGLIVELAGDVRAAAVAGPRPGARNVRGHRL